MVVDTLNCTSAEHFSETVDEQVDDIRVRDLASELK